MTKKKLLLALLALTLSAGCLADRFGLVLWSEIPLCGPGGYNFTGYVKNAEENARLQVCSGKLADECTWTLSENQ